MPPQLTALQANPPVLFEQGKSKVEPKAMVLFNKS